MMQPMSAAAPPSAPPTPATLPPRQIVAAVAGLMLSLLLAAVDHTIVGTAMPRVVAELHGFDRYAWVTTAYMLTSTVVVPIVGKLSDLYGRKRFLIGGAIGFVAASALCGIAQDMTQLIVFRGLQGIGAGTIMANVFAGVSALFPPAQRARIQGMIGGVFGLSTVIGPLVGGYLTDQFSWRAVFYINLPLGIFALAVLWLSFPDIRAPREKRIVVDYRGAVLLVLGLAPLLLALSWGGVMYPWTSMAVLGPLVFGVAMLTAFLYAEARTEEPILPLTFFRNGIVVLSALAASASGIGMFSIVLFVPLFIQAVIGSSASDSGRVLTPMVAAMILTSVASGQVISRTGHYRVPAVLGMSTLFIGLLLLAGMGPETDYLTVVRNVVVIGLGLGIGQTVFTIAPQNAVGFRELGTVTAFTQLARQIGSTVGAAVLGSLLASRFAPALRQALPADTLAALPPDGVVRLDTPQALLNPETAETLRRALESDALYGALIDAIRLALAESLHGVFLAAAAVVAIAVVATLFLKEIALRRTHDIEATPTHAAGTSPKLAAWNRSRARQG
jgi:EmrB/QacA subfamily drug resistance transporter